MSSTVQITDGTTTLNLNDKVNYRLKDDTWAPQIAVKSKSLLDGRDLYEDVTEEIALDILGTSVANALSNLETLIKLLDQSDDWIDNENVSSVKVKYQPDGGTVGVLYAIILGTDDNSSLGELPVTYNDVTYLYQILDVKIHFKRKGLWLTVTESSASSSATPSGDIFSVTLPSSTTPGPNTLKLTMPTTPATDYTLSPNILILTDSASKLAVLEGETFSGTPTFAATSPGAAFLSRGTQVLRYTPAATNTETNSSSTTSVPSLLANEGLYAAFALVRGPVAYGATWSVALSFQFNNNPSIVANAVRIDAAPFTPVSYSMFAISFGMFAVPVGGTTSIQIFAKSTVAGGAFLDFDYLVFAKVDKAYHALLFNETYVPNVIYGTGATVQILLDPLTTYKPFVGISKTDGTLKLSKTFTGNSYINLGGTTVAGVWMVSGSAKASAADNRYRLSDGSDVLWSAVATVSRSKAYRVPQ